MPRSDSGSRPLTVFAPPLFFSEIERIQKGEPKKEGETYLDLFTAKNVRVKERVLIPVKQYPRVSGRKRRRLCRFSNLSAAKPRTFRCCANALADLRVASGFCRSVQLCGEDPRTPGQHHQKTAGGNRSEDFSPGQGLHERQEQGTKHSRRR